MMILHEKFPKKHLQNDINIIIVLGHQFAYIPLYTRLDLTYYCSRIDKLGTNRRKNRRAKIHNTFDHLKNYCSLL